MRKNLVFFKKNYIMHFLYFNLFFKNKLKYKKFNKNIFAINNNFDLVFPNFIYKKKVFLDYINFNKQLNNKINFLYLTKKDNFNFVNLKGNKILLFGKKSFFFDEENNQNLPFSLKYKFYKQEFKNNELNYFFNYNLYNSNLIEIYKIILLLFFFNLNKNNLKIYLRKFNPTTNSSRFKKKVVNFYSSKKPFIRLFVGQNEKAGKNVSGRIVNLNSGGGKKKNIILVDFIRRFSKKLAICINVTFDKNRSCFVSLIKYSNGSLSYILAASKMRPGNIIFSTIIPQKFFLKYSSGCSVILRYLNYKSIFFNVEINEPNGGKYCKSGGTFCKIISLNFDKNLVKIVLPTGFIKIVSMFNLVTIGRASNIENYNKFLTKAGFNRNLGFRPNVRGVAMNPVDNPHGGRTKTNSPELTPWGKIAKKGK